MQPHRHPRHNQPMRNWSSRFASLDEMIYVLIGALVLALGIGAAYLNWQKATQADLLARQNRRAVGLLRQYQSTVAEAESGQRAFLLTGEAEFLTPYSRAMESLDGQLTQLRELGDTHASIGSRLPKIEQLSSLKIAELTSSLQAGWLGEWEFANDLVEQGRLLETSAKLRDIIADVELRTLEDGERLTQETLSSMNMAAFLSVLCCIGLFRRFPKASQRLRHC